MLHGAGPRDHRSSVDQTARGGLCGDPAPRDWSGGYAAVIAASVASASSSRPGVFRSHFLIPKRKTK